MDMEAVKIKKVNWIDVEKGRIDGYSDEFWKRFLSRNVDVITFLQFYPTYSELDNGKYDFISQDHCSCILNIDVDLKAVHNKMSLLNKDKDYIHSVAEIGNKMEGVRPLLKPVRIACADDCGGMIFATEDGKGTCAAQYRIADILGAFGVPDEVLGGDDIPLLFKYGDMEVWLAPQIDSSIEYDGIAFDFKHWCPELFGIKKNNPSAKDIMKLIYSLPKDTTIEELMTRISSLRMADGKTQDVEEYF